ncbi:alpha-galactosidase [Mycetocola zhujimingii]|uniref:alpha-galactosidase n=1 Tax=Mycetocola zhujimingii TaxID=2079792 RepID=A0A2U1TFI1_9MICO|nr:alpha-galactosidase [Mycetocola zhujimingii]PWC07658.1 alpha-galactosidase [Mycetocola zhujimingii]
MISHIRAAGTSFLLDARGTGVPSVVHWGRDLGALDEAALTAVADAAVPAVPPSSIDMPLRLTLLPGLTDGWSGRPGISGFSSGDSRNPGAFSLVGVETPAQHKLLVRLANIAGSLAITVEIELSEHGVLGLRSSITNRASTAFELGSLDVILPVPDRASEVLDFSGLWTHERRPQRHRMAHGVWSRESRHGRPGHDDAFLLTVGTPGFGFRTGEVWAVHLAWSGDKRLWAERSALGPATVGAGELLAPGEARVEPGETWTTPWTIAVYSDAGLDGLSAHLHPWIRSWSTITTPRPVVLNTWEAVYFDHDLTTLGELADVAGRVGVERFVLDDGWFSGRTDDRRALGDWFVDRAKWPDGLMPLIDRVHRAGMDFGLWVEPEMINLDSDTAREHPDWVIDADGLSWRFQHVLDLGNPDAFDWIYARIDALLTEYPIRYLKWDHNRDLLTASAHRQTTALYRLIDAVRAAHPTVEIESCASGGARIDLGILRRVDRVWTSDTNDPLERQEIQRYSSIVIPPEYLGGHLGAARSHTTWRTSDLGFRLATALFGSAGIEWNLTAAGEDELASIATWISSYKSLRGLLHSGTVVRADSSDPALSLHGVVSSDGSTGLFAYVASGAPLTALPAPMRFPGLDPDRVYRVAPLSVGAEPRAIQDAAPPWLGNPEGVCLTGVVLAAVGLPAPLLAPEQAALYSVTAVG